MGMAGVTGFIYCDDYLKYQFGSSHYFQPVRESRTLEILQGLGAFGEKARLYSPKPATEEDLLTVHTRPYVDFVEKACRRGEGYLDLLDTPATKGLYEGAVAVVGGSILGAELIASGEASHAFNPGGGLHHAKEDAAAGFCVFNDVAIATRLLQRRGVRRIAIVDVDGHHADGTQEILYSEPILKVSLHMLAPRFFPGTGFVEEIGVGGGRGYSVNIPLPPGTGDDAYLHAFKEVVPPLLERYEPEAIISQFGVDTHYQDPLVGLSLTTRGYSCIASTMHTLAHKLAGGRLLVLGGGGYSVENTARCWALVFLTISQALPEDAWRHLHDEYNPPRDEGICKRVAERVEEVKKAVFPLHGLKP